MLAVALTLGLVGCGGEEVSEGEQVFLSAGCDGCHTLEAAGADGTAGPSLDETQLSADQVAEQVAEGGAGMPSFDGPLSAGEIEAVAEFVVESAAVTGLAGFEPDSTRLEDCERGDAECYRQAFANLSFRAGPDQALARFERAIASDSAIEEACHPVAHWIGHGALVRYDGNIGRTLVDGSPVCGSGYYHGVLEWKLADVAEDEVAEVARSVCAEPSIEAEAFVYYQCVHGLGHGVMLYSGYDLPGALEVCHGLDSEFDQTSCTGGVFMENQSSSYGVESEWLDDEDLIYPCNEVDEADKLYCYLLVSSRILAAVGGDWAETAEWCRRSEERWVPVCFQSYGRDAAGQTRHSPPEIERLCAYAGEQASECVFGAVREILNNEPDDRRAGQLCERLGGPARNKCVEGIGSMVGVRFAERRDRAEACLRLAPSADVPACLSAAETAIRPG